MKILHVLGIGKLPRDPELEAAGGTTRVALEVARLQAALGHEVVVAAVAKTSWRAEWRGVGLASIAVRRRAALRVGSWKLDLSTLLPLYLFTARRRFDVIHSHEYNYLRYLPAEIRITHFHNDPCRFPAGHPTARWEAAEVLAAARYSHAHVAVSRFVAVQLRRRYDDIAGSLPAGFDVAGRTRVVPNGVDLKRFDAATWRADRERLRREWAFSDQEVVFLFSGATVPEKGIPQLVRAFTRLSREVPRARLVLAGHATLWEDAGSREGINEEHAHYESSLAADLAALETQNVVRRLGLVPPKEMPGVYAAADAVVIPSVVEEACPLVAMEGLAMGKPLVASAVGGLVEHADAGNSLLVEARDEDALCGALRAIAADADLRSRLGIGARRTMESRTWQHTADSLEELYHELLARRDDIVLATPPVFYRF